MKKIFLFFIFVSLCFLSPVESSAKKRRVFPRKWSLSLINGYSFYEHKTSAENPLSLGVEGINRFFSSLEISRNFGYYEIGARIQHSDSLPFVSPFLKWNGNKNNSKAHIVPSLTWGIVPSHLMGSWLRLGLALSLNPYVSISPFMGVYTWYKIKDDPKYNKYNFYLNAGLRINLYY